MFIVKHAINTDYYNLLKIVSFCLLSGIVYNKSAGSGQYSALSCLFIIDCFNQSNQQLSVFLLSLFYLMVNQVYSFSYL